MVGNPFFFQKDASQIKLLSLALMAFFLVSIAAWHEVSLAQPSAEVTQLSTSANLKSNKKSLSVTNLTGIRTGWNYAFGRGVSGLLAYNAHLAGSRLFLHGPQLLMFYDLYGGLNQTRENEMASIYQEFPALIRLGIGPYVQFHDFSSLLSSDQLAFRSQQNFGAKGMLLGGTLELSLQKSWGPRMSGRLGCAFVTSQVPAIASDAVYEGLLLQLGIAYAL